MINKKYVSTSIASALLAIACLNFTPGLHAQNTTNADAMYDGFLKAYLVTLDSKEAYFTVSLTDRSEAFQWNQAYEITGVEDAYDRNKAADRQALISSLLNRYIETNFIDQSSTDLSWDGYNDDAAWATIALARGYQITADPLYLELAGNVWNMAYDRGWDSTLGGGIWETSPVSQNPVDSKCTLSNLSFIPSAIILYQATGKAGYLKKAESIYAWDRAHLFNTDTGQANECVHPTYTDDDTNVYNSGLLVNAAAILYRITGTRQYYNDALLATNFQVRNNPIMTPDYVNNGPFGADQFFRGVSNFARWNDLWSDYYPWFNNNDIAAWQERRTDYDITHNDLATLTPATGDISGMETESAMVLQQVSQIADIAEPFYFSGKYELINAQSKLALTVSGGSTEKGAAVVQEPYVGGDDALWTLIPTSGGYYHIKNVKSGQVLNVSGASALDGAEIIQEPAKGLRPGNDQWMPVQNADGTYTFFNLNSQQVLDDFRASTTAGNQFDQYVANGTAGQKFTLISQ